MQEFIIHLSPYFKFIKTDNNQAKESLKVFNQRIEIIQNMLSDLREIVLEISNKR